MGAINYGYNNHFNGFQLGYNLNDETLTDEENESMQEFLYYDIKELLENYNFNYFNVELHSGYYEGLYITIENPGYNYGVFNNYIEKLEALKELTQLKKLLLELIKNYDLVAYSPGWCTSYYTKQESISQLKDTIKKERENIKKEFTYYTLNRSGLSWWELSK